MGVDLRILANFGLQRIKREKASGWHRIDPDALTTIIAEVSKLFPTNGDLTTSNGDKYIVEGEISGGGLIYPIRVSTGYDAKKARSLNPLSKFLDQQMVLGLNGKFIRVTFKGDESVALYDDGLEVKLLSPEEAVRRILTEARNHNGFSHSPAVTTGTYQQ